jgi:hypothetical protein
MSAVGVLVGPGSALSGSAERTSSFVTHDTSGDLTGQGAVVAGEALLGEVKLPVHRIEITDFEPKLWWLRRPKAVTEEEAKEKVETVAKTIEKVVKAKRLGEAPTKQEVKQAVAPLVQAMPGFDWVKLYEQILIQIQIVESNKRFQAEQARILLDEEDAEILLLLA